MGSDAPCSPLPGRVLRKCGAIKAKPLIKKAWLGALAKTAATPMRVGELAYRLRPG